MKKTQLLSSGLTNKLREEILSEKIPLGSKLTEKHICEQYSISRTPVREALHQLDSEGLIELVPNRGAFVIGFSMGDMSDLYSLRAVYEIQATAWAIERIYKDELEKLEKVYEFLDLYTKRNDLTKLRSLNADFHGVIYEASHNRMLIETLVTYQYYISNSALVNSYQSNHIDEIFEEHSKIFDAFIDRNVEGGKKAMEEHIHNAMRRSGFFS